MTYLQNATKDWSNIPNIVINYNDEFNSEYVHYGYGKIITEQDITIITKKDGTVTSGDGYTNLKARLPRFKDVYMNGKCLKYSDTGKNHGSCPLWLVDNMANSSYYSADAGKQEISGITGYWTFASNTAANISVRRLCFFARKKYEKNQKMR